MEELRALSDRYKRIAGYSIADLANPAAGNRIVELGRPIEI
ncbi:MAG TPA: hypothetical protein VNF99_18370 [Stellaceae bacterium]|nr:hypothetical protein [Stellaceae bacterium]